MLLADDIALDDAREGLSIKLDKQKGDVKERI